MSKKGHTNNPSGRPVKKLEDKIVTPARQLGRVSNEEWAELQNAAKSAGMSFTQWALSVLLKAAKKINGAK